MTKRGGLEMGNRWTTEPVEQQLATLTIQTTADKVEEKKGHRMARRLLLLLTGLLLCSSVVYLINEWVVS